MKRPQPEEYSPFYATYIDKVGDDVLYELSTQVESLVVLLESLPPDKANYAYANGKWTLKEVLGHVIDNERIMAYRLLSFARNDASPLAGYEQDVYIKNSHFATQDLNLLLDELNSLRNANMYLYNSLTDLELQRQGVANNAIFSVKALLFILAGHLKHHQQIIQERYLAEF